MKARLRNVCKRCTESSLQTYFYNIKALAKMGGHDTIPNNHRWINTALLKRIKRSLPLMKFKNMTIAGNKALQAYGKKNEEWAKAMQDSTVRYNKQRDSQKRTPRESKNWPKEGYKALAKLAKELHKEVEHLYEKAPAKVTYPELWQMMRQFVILFYSKHALRGDLADVRIRAPWAQNFLKKTGGSYTLHIGRHKTSRAHGAIQIKLQDSLRKALDFFLPQALRLTDHGFLDALQRLPSPEPARG